MKKEVFGYTVKLDKYCDEDYSSTEPFGEWRTAYTNTFDSITPSKKYPDVVSYEDLKEADIVFVVWVEWSSGDSFGNSARGSAETVGVFSNTEDAWGLKRAIQASSDGKYSFVASTGQEFKSECAPWSGYFENLDAVHIEEVLVS